MKTKSFFALMLGLLLVLGACKKEQEPDSNGNIQHVEQDETPSFDGDEGTVGGHDWVNLGLPSGTLWATCNIGADSPGMFGDYFAWGEVIPKLSYRWETYRYGTADNQLTKYCSNSDYGKNSYIDARFVLETIDDAAMANWGKYWRMPTQAEVAELFNYCLYEWTTYSGSYGCRLVGRSNGRSIFLPAAGLCVYEDMSAHAGSWGLYWTSSLSKEHYENPCNAKWLYVSMGSGGGVDVMYTSDGVRYQGLSVRPVVNR